MTKKIIKIAVLSILGFVAVIICIVYLLANGMCGEEVIGKYISPDTKHAINYFVRDCGTATGFVNNMETDTNTNDFLKNQLKDIDVTVDFSMKALDRILTVNVKDGKYEYQASNCSPHLCSFDLDINNAQYVDADNDGDLDVLVPAQHWNGGNKKLGLIEVFINQSGSLKHTGTVDTGVGTGANWIKAENNVITVNYNTEYRGAEGWADPKTFTYKLEDGKLIQIN